MKIRLATPGDAEECWAVRNQAIRYGCRSCYGDGIIDAWTPDVMPESFSHLVEREFFFVGLDEREKIVATAFLEIKTTTLKALYVLPDLQGNGTGTAILHFVMDEARKTGVTSLLLSSTPNARFFYEKRGFIFTGEKAYTSSITGTDLLCFDMQIEL
ncbi:GNAT family N-acetyltransferase [Pantoea dispersa]|uniref:GNAT family N-acetyltransferase n=1 Tax=Pantoea dispersa TaxID=59814 RepID=UPI001CA6D027|nr:GNAT family N-acetyltransferase [Pantoea dispersa]QZY97836.1 GNAT family N-acetyltransferase [Pantoea dispersa]